MQTSCVVCLGEPPLKCRITEFHEGSQPICWITDAYNALGQRHDPYHVTSIWCPKCGLMYEPYPEDT